MAKDFKKNHSKINNEKLAELVASAKLISEISVTEAADTDSVNSFPEKSFSQTKN